MSLRAFVVLALAALAAGAMTITMPTGAGAMGARVAVSPSSGPREPGGAGAQLVSGMMPTDSPDEVGHANAPQRGSEYATPSATGVLSGVDVASYQHPNGGAITWSQVAGSGPSFAVIKATESTTYTNPYEAGDIAGARQAGLQVGLYHFADPALTGASVTADADAEADYFSLQVNEVAGTQLPPTLDLEENGGLSVAQLVAWTSTFLTRVQADTGRQPMIYTGPSFWATSMGGSTAFTSYPLWEADYTTAADPQSFGGWSSWTLWQWSDGTFDSPAPVPGISGAVDRDMYNGSLSGLEALESASDGVAAGGASYTATGPTRVLDTRVGTGARQGPVGPGGTISLTVPGLPAGTSAVVLNLAGTQLTGAANTYVSACPAAQPLSACTATAVLTAVTGVDIANEITVPVGPDGRITLYNNAGSIDLVGDLVGYEQ